MKKLLTRKQYEEDFTPSIPTGACTFCEWKKYQQVIKEFENWLWIANLAPYWNWHTMVVPKRHFVEFQDQTYKENAELLDVLQHAKRKLLDSGLVRADGVEVKKIVSFWRYRADRRDPITGNVRPDHFHLHIVPDKDRLWDSTLDKNAYKCKVLKKLK